MSTCPLENLIGKTDFSKDISYWKKRQNIIEMQQIINSHYKMICAIANQYRNLKIIAENKFLMEDLIAEGIIGLLIAVSRYKKEYGVKLSTYAHHWIKAKILRFLQKLKPNFPKIPKREQNSQKLFTDYSKIISRPIMSLDKKISSNTDTPWKEFLNETNSLYSENELEEYLKFLKVAVHTFSEREQQIIHERLLNQKPKTLQEIADKLQISKERVRQIETNILDSLKKMVIQKIGNINGFIAIGSLLMDIMIAIAYVQNIPIM